MFFSTAASTAQISNFGTYYVRGRSGAIEQSTPVNVVRAWMRPIPSLISLGKMLKDLRASGLFGSGWGRVLVTEDSSTYFRLSEDFKGMYFTKYLGSGVFSKVRSEIWRWWDNAPVRGVSLSVIDGKWYVVLEASWGDMSFDLNYMYQRVQFGYSEGLEKPFNSGAFRNLHQNNRATLKQMFTMPLREQDSSPKGVVGHGRKPWDRR